MQRKRLIGYYPYVNNRRILLQKRRKQNKPNKNKDKYTLFNIFCTFFINVCWLKAEYSLPSRCSLASYFNFTDRDSLCDRLSHCFSTITNRHFLNLQKLHTFRVCNILNIRASRAGWISPGWIDNNLLIDFGAELNRLKDSRNELFV